VALKIKGGTVTIEERRSTAIHEAGHVVVAWVLGVPVGSVRIGINGDDTSGRAEIGNELVPLSLVDRIALCAAGCAAQELFGCEATHDHAGVSDEGKIIELLSDQPDEEGERLRFEGYDRAGQIISQLHARIERLVGPLTKRGSLSGEDVRMIRSQSD
jgi:hypothetical protein